MIQELDAFMPARSRHPALLDPWQAALDFGPGTVMAVLTETHGPAYRSRGAAMALAADGRFAGALSSGCVEADLMLNAQRVRDSGQPMQLRYGQGSPFIDLRLPCGGAIAVTLFLLRDRGVLAALARARAARHQAVLTLSDAGRLSLGEGAGLRLTFRPGLRFVIFGAGPEAAVFADLVHSLDHDHVLLSHEDQSLTLAERMGCRVRRLGPLPDMAELVPDERCAALLFYHDHDYEPAILRQLLTRPAFYIGAQGSRSTQAARLARLASMRVPAADCARLRGPIGLIPSARDPRQLAISVLAEVMAAAGEPVSVRRTP
ncbi:XdhC family protein [Paracoccus sp. (in: a-proteobacteria)]|uniref:XdhC family protein n=1 Tax=Paracoccus sp. TaxID=267 RepID=UPI00321F7AB0